MLDFSPISKYASSKHVNVCMLAANNTTQRNENIICPTRNKIALLQLLQK